MVQVLSPGLRRLGVLLLRSWEPYNHLQMSEPKKACWRVRGHMEDVLDHVRRQILGLRLSSRKFIGECCWQQL